MNASEREAKLIELLESAIMDFKKLDAIIPGAGSAAAKLYQDELDKILCSLN